MTSVRALLRRKHVELGRLTYEIRSLELQLQMVEIRRVVAEVMSPKSKERKIGEIEVGVDDRGDLRFKDRSEP